MKTLLTAAIVALNVAAAPVLADEAPVPTEGPLGGGVPTAQLGVGDAGIAPETIVHIGGLVFVATATGLILASGGGSSDSPAPVAFDRRHELISRRSSHGAAAAASARRSVLVVASV